MRTPKTIGLAALTALLWSGCGVENAGGPGTDATVQWAVEIDLGHTPDTDPNVGDPQNGPGALGSAPDSVVLSGVGVVIRSLRFVGESGGAVDTNITAEEEDRDKNDAAIVFKGPYVLAADGLAHALGTAAVAKGTYRRVVFASQPARVGDNIDGIGQEILGKSVLVTGAVWRNGRSSRFTFSSDFTSEFAVDGWFEMSSGANLDCRLVFAAGVWFRSNGRWLDPGDADNRLTVLRNIRRNISVRMNVDLE